MMIGHVVETLRREQGLLFGEVSGNGGGICEGFGHGETVVEGPEKIRRDDPIECVHVAVEQGARKPPEQVVSLGGAGAMIFMPQGDGAP